jgi:hypothetical protein
MSEMAKPFVWVWNYVEQVGGYPGQILFCVSVVMLFVGGATWLANKR